MEKGAFPSKELLTAPKLARCDNREVLAKSNSINGSPEDWFSEGNLSEFGLAAISVDFFVNWNERPHRVTRNVWIKKILVVEPEYFLKAGGEICNEKVSETILSSEGAHNVKLLCGFFREINMKIDYLLFRDIDWDRNSEEKIVIARPTIQNGQVVFATKYIDLKDLKSRIQMGSGGVVRVGRKGLVYGTSSLECFLSKTESAYPGDADLIIVDKKSKKAVAIFEYKKHNLSTPLSEQKLGNYYPKPDQRKYDRLAMFRNYIDPVLPLINLYYPTRGEDLSKLEVIGGDVASLVAERAECIKMPIAGDRNSQISYIRLVLDFIDYTPEVS